MTKLTSFFAGAALIAAFGPGVAFAQSSGSYAATGTPAACATNGGSGALSGGATITEFGVSMQTSNGNGVGLLIRPSLVTGLYTDTNVSSTNKNSSGISSATAEAGIQVCVTVDGSTANIQGASCVTYDQRWQQLTTNFFNTALTNCGTTLAPQPCYLDLILSTLSAHSYDFVATNLGQGTHYIEATWSVVGQNNNTTGGNSAACVGPGVLTVAEYKNFSQSSTISY